MKSSDLIKKLKPAYCYFHKPKQGYMVDVKFKRGQEECCGGSGVWELWGIAKDGHVIQLFKKSGTISTPHPEQIESIKIILEVSMDTFRKEYKPLTEEQKARVEAVKNQAEDLLAEMNLAVPLEERSERSRCMAIARTNLEQAIMWAIKGVTFVE